jgi:hypothetical protein
MLFPAIIFKVMNNLKEITLPIFLELDCRNIKEVNNIISNIMDSAESFGLKNKVSLEQIQTHPYYTSSAVIIFSITINPMKGSDGEYFDFLQNIFENYYQYHPRFTEPIL